MSQASLGLSTVSAALPATSRRSLFGAGASLLLLAPAAAGAAKASEIDGELLARCAEFQAHDRDQDRIARELAALPTGTPRTVHDPIWAQLEAVAVHWHAALDAIIRLPARTPEGLAAKASVLRVATSQGMHEAPDAHELLALSLTDDIAGRA